MTPSPTQYGAAPAISRPDPGDCRYSMLDVTLADLRDSPVFIQELRAIAEKQGHEVLSANWGFDAEHDDRTGCVSRAKGSLDIAITIDLEEDDTRAVVRRKLADALEEYAEGIRQLGTSKRAALVSSDIVREITELLNQTREGS